MFLFMLIICCVIYDVVFDIRKVIMEVIFVGWLICCIGMVCRVWLMCFMWVSMLVLIRFGVI